MRISSRIFTCPKCKLTMKSKSGWTLHVKACCPEQRWRMTTMKMLVEFGIPVALDADEPYFGTKRARRGFPKGPADIFDMAFWPKEIKQIGNCNLISAEVVDQKISLREPTPSEKRTMARVSAEQNKTQTIAEYKRVLKEIVGDSLFVHVSTSEWPTNITIMLAKRRLRTWEAFEKSEFIFNFDVRSGAVAVGAGGRSRAVIGGKYVYTYQKAMIARLADPTSFDQIRTFTGLQPASASNYPCPKCGVVMKSKSGRTLHLKTCNK